MTKKGLFILLTFLCLAGSAQVKTHHDRDYAQKPYWIKMMDIEGVNFNETLKAYDIYWQHHELPQEQGDRYSGKGELSKINVSKKELKERREEAEMGFQVKKFLHWKIRNEPFVKENGNIMTAAERLQFHQQHQ